MAYRIVKGQIEAFAKHYQGERFHALMCDPPYHLNSIVKRFGKEDGAPAKEGTDGAFARASRGFMGKAWDGGDIAFRPETWKALAKLLYPGAFLIAFAGSRGWHRQAVAMEDAGLIMHPSVFGWGFGQGFPKATNIAEQCRSERGVIKGWHGKAISNWAMENLSYTSRLHWRKHEQATAGHRYGGQAMKPALEPILVFQKPYEGRPIDNITQTGAGALNIDGGRIEGPAWARSTTHKDDIRGGHYGAGITTSTIEVEPQSSHQDGRWPSHFTLSHLPDCRRVGVRHIKNATAVRSKSGGQTVGGSKPKPPMDDMGYGIEQVATWDCTPDCPVAAFDAQAGPRSSGKPHGVKRATNHIYSKYGGQGKPITGYGDSGAASRFFHVSDWNGEVEERLLDADPVMYEPKVSRAEREAGLDDLPEQVIDDGRPKPIDNAYQRGETVRRNVHPTVKPIALTQWLATLLLPPDAYAPRRILIPFAGVGSEMIGAMFAGWDEIVGVEMTPEYVDIAKKRLAHWADRRPQPKLF